MWADLALDVMALGQPSSLRDRADPTKLDQLKESAPPRRPDPPSTQGARAMSLARVQFFSISLDGFGTGEGQSREAPFGHAGDRLHEWMFVTRWWHEMVGEPGGTRGIDDAVLRQFAPGIGAEIMGAGKFGYPGWH